MVVALIPHFSWWNPFTWNFDQIWADVAQGFGQLVGARSGPARCSGSPPTWVNQLVGVSNAADIVIHACAQSQDNVLDIEMVNNRPYGQVLTYGSGVQWGWHEKGDSKLDQDRNSFMDSYMGRNQLYIPPLGRASVGILQPPAGQSTTWHIGPTDLSIGADFAFYLAGQVVGDFAPVGHCSQAVVEDTPLTSVTPVAGK
jgi:hypothetical protein